MTFLSPWMLLGGAAVGVPIALHFFYKARYRRLPWAAMEFLREAIEQTLMLSLGAASLTRDKVEAVVEDFVRRGEIGSSEGRAIVDRLMAVEKR